jgi:hypothetical protein
MCSIYECPKTVMKKLASGARRDKPDGGSIKIENAFPVILWATTPENFSTHSSVLDVNSGWLLRLLYYYPDYPKTPVKMRFGYDRDIVDKTINDKYIAICEKLNTYDNIIAELTPGAQKAYHDWQIPIEERIAKDCPQYGAAFNRLEMVVFKLAMKYQICEPEFLTTNLEELKSEVGGMVYGHKLVVTEETIRIAISHIEKFFLPHTISVIERVARDASKNMQDRIIAELKLAGGKMNRRDMGRKLHVKTSDLDEHLGSLEENEEIYVGKVKLGCSKATCIIQLL